jgi:hypothetical protein
MGFVQEILSNVCRKSDFVTKFATTGTGQQRYALISVEKWSTWMIFKKKSNPKRGWKNT